MSYDSSYHCGYGVRLSDVSGISVDKLEKLLHLAPLYENGFKKSLLRNWLENHSIRICDWNEIPIDKEYWNYGLASILCAVMKEKEGIEFTICYDMEDNAYLLYEPKYPWKMDEKDIGMTEEKICSILLKYISVITDIEVPCDYYEPDVGE